MNFSDRRGLKNAANASLGQASWDPKKLILIHTGALLLLSLVLNIISSVLSRQIDGTGGLSGLGLRSVLSTIQALLPLLQALLIPFWEMGLILAMLNISRGKSATPDTLLGGFRRFGPVLRLSLLRGFLIMGILLASIYLSLMIYLVTPLSASLQNALLPLMDANGTLDPELAIEVLDPTLFLPFLCLMGVVALVMMMPVIYRYRMADYFLMDHPKAGAMLSLQMSQQLLFRKRIELFKLDLSFWWYYLLEGLAAVVFYSDVLLQAFGIQLPIDSTVLSYAVFVLYALCTLAVHWFARDRVEVTYAKAYDALLEAYPPMPGTNPTEE